MARKHTPYFLSLAGGSHCASCQQPVELLATQGVTGPSFYVCWTCRAIGQIGVGIVATIEIKREL